MAAQQALHLRQPECRHDDRDALGNLRGLQPRHDDRRQHAEAGIEDARAALASTPINPLLGAGGNLFTNSPVGAGTYSVLASNNVGTVPNGPTFPTGIVPSDPDGATNDTDQFLVLNSTGTVRKASRRIQTVVRMPLSFFNYGVWCDVGGTISGGGNNLTLPVPPTSYYFSEVTLSGGATLSLDTSSGQHVDMYVSGKMTTSGGSGIHYDQALAGGSIPSVVARTWREILP